MRVILSTFLLYSTLVVAQQQCYYAAGAEHRGPNSLVPCNGTGESTCCLLGDTCLSGNACYNYATGDVYQYGCTDINYQDETCPYKCGWDPALSPWTALEYCNDIPQVDDTWTCHAPESCGCDWNSTYNLLVLEARGCAAMGSDARVALYAPSTLAPYVSLPSTYSGSTGYYSQLTVSGTLTWVSTVIAGYTPATFTQFTTYRAAPTSNVTINPGATPDASTYAAAKSYSSTPSQSLGGNPAGTSGAPSTTSIGSSSSSTTTSYTSTPIATSIPSPGLSTGAKIGIGVGVGGGVLLLAAVALAAFLWGRHRHKRPNAGSQAQPGHGHHASQSGTPYYPHSPPMGQTAPPYQQVGGHWLSFAGGDGQQQYFDQHHTPGGAVSPDFAAQKKAPYLSPAELSTDSDQRPYELGSEGNIGANLSPLKSPPPGPGRPSVEGSTS